MRTHLKRGYDFEHRDGNRFIEITVWNDESGDNHPDMVPTTVRIDLVGTRSLGCFINRVAWHRRIKK